MKKYKALTNISAGKDYRAAEGETIELPDSVAEQLLDYNAVQEVAVEPAKKASKKDDTAEA